MTKDPTKRIEWMELLKVNISNDGKLIAGQQDRLLLVEEEGATFDSLKLTESKNLYKEVDIPAKKGETNSQSYSPPSN